MLTEIDALALHEAAHAVIGRKLGMTCGGVTIIADEDSTGHHVVADPHKIQWDWEHEREKFRDPSSVYVGRIMTFMAGAEAEIMMYGQTRGGDGDDRFQCELMIEEVPVPKVTGDRLQDQQIYLERLRAKTRGRVQTHMPDIWRVAEALKRKQTLSAEEIDTLLGLHASPG